MPVPDFTEPVSPEFLPRQFALTLTSDEMMAVVEWAGRYAPAPNVSFDIDCCFLPGGRRRWVAREANVIGWLDFTDDSQPVRGAVSIPLHFLHSINLSDGFDEGAVVGFDLDASMVSARVGEVVVGIDLPPLPDSVVPPLPDAELCAHVSAVDVAAAASPLRMNLSASVDDDLADESRTALLPFVTLQVDPDVIRFRRDWTEFGNSAVNTEAAAWGMWGLDASFHADVVLRELYLADEMQGSVVTFGFHPDEPAVMVVSGGNWGMIVTLGTDVVLRYRGDIELALAMAEMEYEADPHIGWNPVVVATVQGRRVEARLVRAATLNRSHVRVSTVVTGGVSWNPDLAAEMNLWNDKWFDAKLVLERDDLVVVTDVAVADIEKLPTILLNVVEKSLIVYDVVGVFM